MVKVSYEKLFYDYIDKNLHIIIPLVGFAFFGK